MATSTSEIQALYVAYFNRPAEPLGLQFWLDRANAKGGADFVANEFSNSKEYTDMYAGKSNADIVDTIYMNLFGRHAETAGKDYWAEKLTKGELNIGNVARIISTSAQNADLVAITNKLAAAAAFTASLTGAELDGYDGPAANAVVRTWLTGINTVAQLLAATTPAAMDVVAAAAAEAKAQANAVAINLTAGVDALTGTEAVEKYVAEAGTFNDGDTIDGGAGNDSLTVISSGALTMAGKNISNVETIILRGDNAITADTSVWAGVTALNVTAAAGNVDVKAGDASAISLGGITGAGSITSNGGKSVSVSNSDVDGALSISTAASDTITLADVSAGAISTITDTSTGGTTLKNLNVDKLAIKGGLDVYANALANLAVTGGGGADGTIRLHNNDYRGYTLNVALSGADRFEVEDVNDNAVAVAFSIVADSAISLSAGAAQKISVDGNGVLQLFEGIGSNLANIREVLVTGTSGIEADLGQMDKFRSFDASGSTGNSNVSLSALQGGLSVKGGSGNDKIVVDGALTATAVVTLGAGDDYLQLNAAPVALAIVEAGADTDTLALANGAHLVTGIYSGFEVLEVGDGTGNYDMDFLSGSRAVTLTGDATSGALTIADAAANTSLALAALDSTSLLVTDELAFKLKTNTATSSLDLQLSAMDGDDDGAADGIVKVSKLALNDMETINVVSNVSELDADKSTTPANEATVAGAYVNELTELVAGDLKTLNVSGNAGFKIGSQDSSLLARIDAHALTGNLSINAANSAHAIDFIGGLGNDVYVAPELAGTINAGRGADTITLNADKIAVDTFVLASGDSMLTAKADGHDIITNFATTIVLDRFNLLAFNFTGTRAGMLDKGALAASVVNGSQLAQADFFDNLGTERAVAMGTYAGSTFVFVDVDKNGDFNALTDLFVQLAGVTDLTVSSFVFS